MNFNNDSSDLEARAIKASDRLSEMMRMVCNEPALALYRIQEHSRNTLPLVLDKKTEVDEMQKEIQGSVFDADYALKAIKSISSSSVLFTNIEASLKSALYNKQQLRHNAIKQNMMQQQQRKDASRRSRITPLSNNHLRTLTASSPPTTSSTPVQDTNIPSASTFPATTTTTTSLTNTPSTTNTTITTSLTNTPSATNTTITTSLTNTPTAPYTTITTSLTNTPTAANTTTTTTPTESFSASKSSNVITNDYVVATVESSSTVSPSTITTLRTHNDNNVINATDAIMATESSDIILISKPIQNDGRVEEVAERLTDLTTTNVATDNTTLNSTTTTVTTPLQDKNS